MADENNTAAAVGERNVPRQKQKRVFQTRARTGCQRCRARRRKCDEAKPRCARCYDAGVKCQYVTRVSFLQRNNQTPAQDASARPGYSAVQFVNTDGSSKLALEVEGEVSTPSPHPGQPLSSFDGSSDRRRHPGEMVVESPSDLVSPATRPATQSDQSAGPPESAIDSGTKNLTSQDPHSTDHTIYLLRHYTHHVAPWLDVFDLGRTFGVLIPQLTATSPRILDAVLELSAASSGLKAPADGWRRDGAVVLQSAASFPEQSQSYFGALQLMATIVLSNTQLFVEAVPDTWEPMFAAGGRPPSFKSFTFTEPIHRRIWDGFIVLMLRLEVAHSLIHEVAPVWGSEVLHEVLESSSENMDSQGIQSACVRCLSLLSDVMSLCLERPDDSTPSAPNPSLSHESRGERWKSLLVNLRAWHSGRPPEVQPMAELEGRGAAFPAVLFSTSAGISANVMYHTAMHLLLSHKPRAVRPLDDQDQAAAAQMSPLWHARRICGIAMTCERTECWDPCMIAAFSLAARRMTHEAQQRDLLACLEGVKAAGWRVDGIFRRLREEWGPFEPS